MEKDFPIKVYFSKQNLKKIPLLVLVDLFSYVIFKFLSFKKERICTL
nr:MAG TPA: hypothetical protein [Caudoviricetes sp.]